MRLIDHAEVAHLLRLLRAAAEAAASTTGRRARTLEPVLAAARMALRQQNELMLGGTYGEDTARQVVAALCGALGAVASLLHHEPPPPPPRPHDRNPPHLMLSLEALFLFSGTALKEHVIPPSSLAEARLAGALVPSVAPLCSCLAAALEREHCPLALDAAARLLFLASWSTDLAAALHTPLRDSRLLQHACDSIAAAFERGVDSAPCALIETCFLRLCECRSSSHPFAQLYDAFVGAQHFARVTLLHCARLSADSPTPPEDGSGDPSCVAASLRWLTIAAARCRRPTDEAGTLLLMRAAFMAASVPVHGYPIAIELGDGLLEHTLRIGRSGVGTWTWDSRPAVPAAVAGLRTLLSSSRDAVPPLLHQCAAYAPQVLRLLNSGPDSSVPVFGLLGDSCLPAALPLLLRHGSPIPPFAALPESCLKLGTSCWCLCLRSSCACESYDTQLPQLRQLAERVAELAAPLIMRLAAATSLAARTGAGAGTLRQALYVVTQQLRLSSLDPSGPAALSAVRVVSGLVGMARRNMQRWTHSQRMEVLCALRTMYEGGPSSSCLSGVAAAAGVPLLLVDVISASRSHAASACVNATAVATLKEAAAVSVSTIAALIAQHGRIYDSLLFCVNGPSRPARVQQHLLEQIQLLRSAFLAAGLTPPLWGGGGTKQQEQMEQHGWDALLARIPDRSVLRLVGCCSLACPSAGCDVMKSCVCGHARYCSTRCQRQAWRSGHRAVCRAVRQAKAVVVLQAADQELLAADDVLAAAVSCRWAAAEKRRMAAAAVMEME